MLVVGAGAMSSLAVATAARQGAAQIVVANRTRGRAERLAARYGATVTSLAELPAGIAAADLVIACTGAAGHVVTQAAVAAAARARTTDAGRAAIVLLDLALPRDVEASVGELPGVALIDLAVMGAAGGSTGHPGAAGAASEDVAAVRRIVAEELAAYAKADRAASVAPTVVALRAKAATVVESELARLERRLAGLDARTRREIAQAMGRVADKLLHGPTVRVKELAGSPGVGSYEDALRVLFELEQDAVESLITPEVGWPAGPEEEAAP